MTHLSVLVGVLTVHVVHLLVVILRHLDIAGQTLLFQLAEVRDQFNGILRLYCRDTRRQKIIIDT